MQPRFLSFRTADGPSVAEWSATGDALRRALADALQRRGFLVDLEAGAQDPDWFFLARRGADTLGVVLVVACFRPCRWHIGLEDGSYRNLTSDALREEINPILESVVAAWPGVSTIRWHPDMTTLKDA